MDPNKRLRTKIGKLISGARKTDEGFAAVFDYEPKDFLEKQHGNMYFVAEVASGSKRAVEVGETVINAIKDEFYDDLNRSVVLSMESALRKANEELSDLTSAGETDWIGKLNVVCAVISENKLHLAKVGATEAYIVRGSKITHISEGTSVAEEETHPMKTFSTITSGGLQQHDKLLLSTSELLTHVSISGIKKILHENSPAESVKRMKDLLRSEEGIGSIGTLVVEMLTEEELAKEQGDEIDEIWIEEPKPAQAAKDIFTSLGVAILGFFKKTVDSIKNRAIPSLKQTGKEAKAAIKGEKLEKSTEEEEKKKEGKAERKQEEEKKDQSFLSFVSEYFKKFSFKKFSEDVKKVFSGIGNFITKKTKSKYFKYLAGALVLILITGIILTRNYYVNKNKEEFRAKLDYASQLYEDAENALIYEARNEAKENLLESRGLVEEVLSSNYYAEEAQSLASKIDIKIKEADGIFEISPNQIIELSDYNPSEIVILDKKIYALDSGNKKIVVYDIERKNKEEISIESNYNLVSATPQERLGNVIITTEEGEVFELDSTTNKVEKATSVSGEFKKGKFIDSYQSNMYIISPKDNQIYRYTRLATGFSSPSNYINDNSVSISDAVSSSIPGTVLILHENGEITEMLRGKKQAFSFSGLPYSLENPVELINNVGSSTIYVLDKTKGLVAFKADGSYIKTVTSSEFNDIKNIAVDEDSQTIYLLAGNKIFSFGL